MKHKICCMVMFLSYITMVNAQIAQWQLRPEYDTIFIPEESHWVLADSLNHYYTKLWDFDGTLVAQFEDRTVHPFHEKTAVITDRNNTNIRGFLWESGDFVEPQQVSLPRKTFLVDPSYPFFSNGYLLMIDPSTRNYWYVDRNGKHSRDFYTRAFPFFNGFAKCERYEKMDRPKKKIQCLLTPNMDFVQFSYDGKKYSLSDIDFVSSVNDDMVAIVVAKEKVFFYYADSNIMKPLCAKKDVHNKSGQAKMSDDLDQCLVEYKDRKEWSLTVKSDNTTFTIVFDQFMKPKAIGHLDMVKNYIDREKEKKVLETSLRVTRGTGGFGLNRDGKEVLAPQFEEIPICFGDRAIVKKNGKFGMIKISPDDRFEVSIDKKGEKIPFAHKNTSSFIRIEYPSALVSSNKVELDLVDSSGCMLDLFSKKEGGNGSLSYIQYDCDLSIPKELFNEDNAIVIYPIRLVYDGFISPVINVEKSVWLSTNWRLGQEENQSVKDGKCTFKLYLINDNPDGITVPRHWSYQIDTNQPDLKCSLEKRTDFYYICTVEGLQVGSNKIDIEITEDGFPPLYFPLIINYEKEIILSKGKEPEQIVEKTTTETKQSETRGKKKTGSKKTNSPMIIDMH